MRELDTDGYPLPFPETKRGKAYAIAVRRTVKELGRKRINNKIVYTRVTLSQIKEAVGEEGNILDTIETLVGARGLEYQQNGARGSWVYVEPPMEKPRHFIHASEHRAKIVLTPTDRTRPSVESFERGRA